MIFISGCRVLNSIDKTSKLKRYIKQIEEWISTFFQPINWNENIVMN